MLRRLEEQLKRVEATVDDIWSETRDVPGKNDACRGRAQLLRGWLNPQRHGSAGTSYRVGISCGVALIEDGPNGFHKWGYP